MVKKGFMVQLWRIQQSQAIAGLFFWSLTLAGIFYLSYFHDHFVALGIVKQSDVFLGTIILFLMIIISFLLLGLVYDRFLRLWKEQTDVIYERNPYTREKLMAKEVVFWQKGTLSIMKELAKKDSSLAKDVEFMERWIEKSTAHYKEIEKDVDRLEKWVMS